MEGSPISGVDALLERLRSTYRRCEPDELGARLADGALVVDTRPSEQRHRDGDLEGAVVIDRNVLEWRLDPSAPTCLASARQGREVVVVCNEGYSSTLAAVSLRSLGVDATDLVGGYQALLARRAGPAD